MADASAPIGWQALGDWRSAGPELQALADGLVAAGVDGDRPAAALWVPGRVELLGKHTDYAGGRSLVGAIDRGLLLLATPRSDSTVRWRDLGRGVEIEFDVANPGRRPGHWSNYVLTPARRVASDFEAFSGGLDLAMTSSLPAAAGLSSSSALLVAAYLVFEACDADPPVEISERTRLAAYLGAVEGGAAFEGANAREGVGTFGGSEDHAAILKGTAGEVMQCGFSPLRVERQLAWPAGWQLVIGVSGAHAKKTGDAKEAFNRLARDAAQAAAAFGRVTGTRVADLGAALESAGTAADLERRVVAGSGPGEDAAALARRTRHFAVESGRLVSEAAQALASESASALGRAAAESQGNAEALLGNQIDETRALVRLAIANGAPAASAFGAGFGGSVWALAPATEVEEFRGRWREAYTAAFPHHEASSLFFVTAPSQGAHWLPTEPDVYCKDFQP